MKRISVLLLLIAACGDDDAAECVVASDCPLGEICLDGRCIVPDEADAGVDAPVDSRAPDVPIDAEVIGEGCSADLQSILDADGNELMRCAPDLGCFDGRCIDACEAAERSGGTLSCEFVAPTPSMWTPIVSPCFAVFVANAWPRAVQITLTRGGATYDLTEYGRLPVEGMPPEMWPPVPATGVPADGVAVLFLSSDPEARGTRGDDLTCPVTPAIDAATELVAPGIGDAFRVETDTPVAAYDIFPFGGSRSFVPSAQLLFPTSVWAEEHLVFAPPVGTLSPPEPLWIRVVADADGTTVRVRPTVDLIGGGTLPSVAAGTEGTVTLDRGQYAFWQTNGTDPTGTVVDSDGRVGVFSGNRLLRLQPVPHPGGDAEHQPSMPFEALASEYVGAPYETRRADLVDESILYRILGAIDGTELSFDPPVAGAPSAIDQGEVINIEVAGPVRVSSQDAEHPFAFGQLMKSSYHFTDMGIEARPGVTRMEFDNALGDEEFVVLFPPAQFLSRYVFFTDPTYGTTNLALTRARGDDGEFADVTVDCLGTISDWTAVGSDGRFEVASVDLRRAGVGVATCQPGRHVAQSSEPFGLVVWGIDLYASYAYPAGGNARVLTELPPLL